MISKNQDIHVETATGIQIDIKLRDWMPPDHVIMINPGSYTSWLGIPDRPSLWAAGTGMLAELQEAFRRGEIVVIRVEPPAPPAVYEKEETDGRAGRSEKSPHTDRDTTTAS